MIKFERKCYQCSGKDVSLYSRKCNRDRYYSIYCNNCGFYQEFPEWAINNYPVHLMTQKELDHMEELNQWYILLYGEDE